MDFKDEDDWYSSSENSSKADVNVESMCDENEYDEVMMEPIMFCSFKSPCEAEVFYIEYARRKGFDVRRSHRKIDNGIVKNVEFSCSREGFRVPPKEGRKYNRRSRDETRCGCKARLRIAHDIYDGKYKVTHFEGNHNHPLESAATSHRLKCNRYMTATHKALLSRMSNAGIGASKTMDWLEYMEGGSGQLSFTKKDGYNYLNKEKMRLVQHGDVNTALSFLEGLQVNDEELIFKYTIDETDKTLTRLFWSDGFSKAQYRLFGDVLLFDSTYKTNNFKFPLVILSGVDNHLRTCIFGTAIMYNESIESYRWLLKTFREAMEWEDPISILTDQDAAMHNAIQEEFPNAKHRLCSWHLQRNCTRKVRLPPFTKAFGSFLKNNICIEEFEIKWHELVEEHGLSQHRWVVETYAKREQWSEAHFRGHFFGMMRSTQRAESLNSLVKDRGAAYGFKLTQFLKHYLACLARLRGKFKIDQATSQSPNQPSFIPTTLVSYQKHAASIYTRYIFFVVEKEIFEAQGLVLEESKNIDDKRFVFTFVEQVKDNCRRRFIEIDWETGKFECDCLMLESDWLPCRHLFAAFKFLNLTEIPSPCIHKRWTVDIGRGLLYHFPNTFTFEDPQSSRFTKFYKECLEFCLELSEEEVDRDNLMSRLREVVKQCREELNISPERKEKRDDQSPDKKKRKGDDKSARCYGIGDPPKMGSEQYVNDPSKIKSRGAPKSTMQRCGICRKPGHKATTCDNKKGKNVGDGGKSHVEAMEEDNICTQSSRNVS